MNVFEFPEDRAVSIAAALYGVAPRNIRSHCRDAATSNARMIVYRLLRDDGMTVESIGEYLDRNHSAVSHGLHRVSELITFDKRFVANLEAARKAFLVLTPA